MPNYYPSYYMPAYQQPVQPQQGVVWVSSDAEAMNHIVMANSCVTLRSTDGKTVYFKSADASGKPSIEIYSLQPRQTVEEAKPDYVTRQEVIDLINQLKSAKKEAAKE